MKPFAKYLAESERTYNYRVKICGKVADDFVKQFKQKLIVKRNFLISVHF